jgi:hypothetical protein
MVAKNEYRAGSSSNQEYLLHLELMPKDSGDRDAMAKIEVIVSHVPSAQDERYHINAAGLDSSRWVVISRWLECINPKSAGSLAIKEQAAVTDFVNNQDAALIIPELSGAKIRRTPDGKFSVYDLIRICTGNKNPRQFWWGDKSERKNRQKGLVERYPEVVRKSDNFQFPGKGQKETPVADLENCLYILGLLPGECGKSYREKAANLVRRYIQGDADLGMEMIIRDHNKERVDRAKKRLLVCDTNKEASELARKNGVPPSQVHNDRYRGLYQMNASQLREDGKISKNKTPLDAMSTYDLTLNSLANMMALQCENPNAIMGVSVGLRDLHESKTGKQLKPVWEERSLRPDQARKVLSDGQMELPV